MNMLEPHETLVALNSPQIEMRDVQSLLPYAQNARTHSPAQIEQIAASIREFGWTNPVLIDGRGGIVAGHGRVRAAQLLGIAAVPCICLAHLNEAQRRAYILADNQLALNAGWDAELLKIELTDLHELGFELPVLGFSDAELEEYMAEGTELKYGNSDPNELPQVSPNVITQPDDVWILGWHRIICGDSTSRGTVLRLLAGEKPNLMVTDPPYGVEYEPEWRNEIEWADGKQHGNRAIGETLNDDRVDWRETWALFPGEIAYIWHASLFASTVQASLEACDFELRSQIIWAKPRFVISRGHYHWQHEACWYAVRKGCGANWRGDHSQTSLWRIDQEKRLIIVRKSPSNVCCARS